MTLVPKGMPGADDCCSPWQKILQRMRELETALSQRIKAVKVNDHTYYPVNDGVVILPDYPEGGGSVESITVDGTKYTPDAEGDVALPDYPPDLSTEVGSLDSRLESVEDDVGTIGFAVIGLGDKLTAAEGDIDALEGRMDTVEDDIDIVQGVLETYDDVLTDHAQRIDQAEQDVSAILTDLPNKPYMHTGATDPDGETIGRVGDFYLNTTSNDLFQCKAVSPGEYTWEEVGGGGSGGDTLDLWRTEGEYRLATGFYKGSMAYTPGEFWTYLQGLTTAELANVYVFSYDTYTGVSVPVLAHVTNRNATYVRFVTGPIVGQSTKTANYYFETSLSSTVWTPGNRDKYLMGRSQSLYLAKKTYTAGTSYTLGSMTGAVKVYLTHELMEAYRKGDVTITMSSSNVLLRFVNDVTLTEASYAETYDIPFTKYADIEVTTQVGSFANKTSYINPRISIGDADPTVSDEGFTGDFFLNKTDDKLFKCLGNDASGYLWSAVGGGSGGTKVMKVTTTYLSSFIPAFTEEISRDGEVIGWGPSSAYNATVNGSQLGLVGKPILSISKGPCYGPDYNIRMLPDEWDVYLYEISNAGDLRLGITIKKIDALIAKPNDFKSLLYIYYLDDA